MPLPKKFLFSVEDLTAVLHFNPETGLIVNACRRSNHAKDALAGGPRVSKENGIYYWRIYLFGGEHQAHRLMYYVATGKDPGHLYVDHRNQDTLDNRIENLRLVTIEENNNNKSIYGSKKVMNVGVKLLDNGLYQINIEDYIYPKLFEKLPDAIRARYSLLHDYYS